MLNIPTIKKAMQQLGLNQVSLAEECQVSKESVSNWLSGESIPRPNKLKALAQALQLEVQRLLLPAVAEPIVAYRTHNNRPVSVEAFEAANDLAYHLRQLVPFIQRTPIFAPPVLESPRVEEEYIREAVRQIRSRIGIPMTQPLTREQLLGLHHDFGSLLVPVLWGKDKDGHENALSVYLPDSRTSWVVFNLNARNDDFNYWLAHELGHCYTLHALQGQDGEDFAERFAQELLFPMEAAVEALALITSHPQPREAASRYAGRHELSVVTVVKQLDRAAEILGQPPTGLVDKRFWVSWRSTRALVPTVTESVFGLSEMSTAEYVIKSEDHFKTPVFRALAQWQRSEGGRSPAFIANALNVELGLALDLSHFLLELHEPVMELTGSSKSRL